jgi:hypothetical protein
MALQRASYMTLETIAPLSDDPINLPQSKAVLSGPGR